MTNTPDGPTAMWSMLASEPGMRRSCNSRTSSAARRSPRRGSRRCAGARRAGGSRASPYACRTRLVPTHRQYRSRRTRARRQDPARERRRPGSCPRRDSRGRRPDTEPCPSQPRRPRRRRFRNRRRHRGAASCASRPPPQSPPHRAPRSFRQRSSVNRSTWDRADLNGWPRSRLGGRAVRRPGRVRGVPQSTAEENSVLPPARRRAARWCRAMRCAHHKHRGPAAVARSG